jgi:hypothetical protein
MRGEVASTREEVSAAAGVSERTLMVGTVLLVSAVSAAMTYILTQYYGVDALSSLIFFPEDCWGDWHMQIGRHCFSDYAMVVPAVLQPNPWEGYPLFPPHPRMGIQYPAAAMLPHLLFGLLGKWFGAPLLGLIGYLVVLSIAVLSPAVWAARGARGLERVVIFVALGAAAVPAWMVIDRGNSTGFVVPIALVFLIALCRRRWGLVTIMVVLAALVKPQFAVLAVALFAARQWRWGGIALAGIAVSNFAAYFAWPRAFPETIETSIHHFRSLNDSNPMLFDIRNVSFGKALLLIPDNVKALQTGGTLPDGFLLGPRLMIGYVVLLVVVASVLVLGRRMPAVMVGVLLLVTATFTPPLTLFYYLVCVLPVAALLARDPDGPPGAGLFDRFAAHGDRRRAVGICLSVAAAFTIAQFVLPGPTTNIVIKGIGMRTLASTTTYLTPILWLVACSAIIVSYARRPDRSAGNDEGPDSEGRLHSDISKSAKSEPEPETVTARAFPAAGSD